MTSTWESSPELPDGAPPPPAAPPEGPRGDATWPWWIALLGLPVALIVVNIVSIPVLIADGGDADLSGTASLIATYLQTLVFIGTPVVLALLFGKPVATSFGLRWPRFWPALGWLLLTLLVVNIIGAVVSQLFDVDQNDQDNLIDTLGIDEGGVGVYFLAFAVCVGAPLGEEFLFRGFIFGGLLPKIGVIGAALVSALIFGLLHFGNYAGDPLEVAVASVIILTVLGVGFALLYWRTRSLVPAIALHAINNSLAFGVMQDWSWQIAPLMALSLLFCGIAVWLTGRFWRKVPGPWPAPLSSQ